MESGQLLGRIHLDLHPRERKYNHAAQFTLVNGVLGRQLPEGVLVCNFPRGLMDHDDVVTLFHEFGHLMHHVLAGRHAWATLLRRRDRVGLRRGAVADARGVGLGRRQCCSTFATDADGEPIPEELVVRMRAADEFGKAFLARTQTAYAAVSYWFHQERPADQTARLDRAAWSATRWSRWCPTPTSTPRSATSRSTPRAYYTYAWSLVIAKDLFSAFDPDDLFATEVAHRYRDRVLVPGGSKDAADLVRDFLGRPYDDRAFRAWLEREPEIAR